MGQTKLHLLPTTGFSLMALGLAVGLACAEVSESASSGVTDKGLSSSVYRCEARNAEDRIRSFVVDLDRKEIIVITAQNPGGIKRVIQCKNNSSILGRPVLFCAIKDTADQVYLFNDYRDQDQQGNFNATYMGMEEHPASCSSVYREQFQSQILETRVKGKESTSIDIDKNKILPVMTGIDSGSAFFDGNTRREGLANGQQPSNDAVRVAYQGDPSTGREVATKAFEAAMSAGKDVDGPVRAHWQMEEGSKPHLARPSARTKPAQMKDAAPLSSSIPTIEKAKKGAASWWRKTLKTLTPLAGPAVAEVGAGLGIMAGISAGFGVAISVGPVFGIVAGVVTAGAIVWAAWRLGSIVNDWSRRRS